MDYSHFTRHEDIIGITKSCNGQSRALGMFVRGEFHVGARIHCGYFEILLIYSSFDVRFCWGNQIHSGIIWRHEPLHMCSVV